MKTNETNGATLRPWKQNGGNINGKWETGQEVGIAMVGTTRFCGDECGGPKDIRMKAEDKANAALIVASVNSYDALQAVANSARECLAYGYVKRCEARDELIQAIAAIDKLNQRFC